MPSTTMSWGASVVPLSCPVSWLGMKPLGTSPIEINGGHQGPGGKGQHGEEAVADDAVEGPSVEVARAIEDLFGGALEGVLVLPRGP